MERSQHYLECAECDNLASRYESATFAFSRVESALMIAELMYDDRAIQRLTAEAHDSAARKRQARAALAEHRAVVHQIGERQHVA